MLTVSAVAGPAATTGATAAMVSAAVPAAKKRFHPDMESPLPNLLVPGTEDDPPPVIARRQTFVNLRVTILLPDAGAVVEGSASRSLSPARKLKLVVAI